jgi:hypothetical protein
MSYRPDIGTPLRIMSLFIFTTMTSIVGAITSDLNIMKAKDFADIGQPPIFP